MDYAFGLILAAVAIASATVVVAIAIAIVAVVDACIDDIRAAARRIAERRSRP